MTSVKRLLAVSFFAGFIVLAGCGSGEEAKVNLGSAEAPSNPSDSTGIQPDIHINVPPPADAAKNSEDAAQSFFEKKEVYDTFSEELKTQIYGSFSAEGAAGVTGPDGNPFFNTLMGRTAPQMLVKSGESITGVGCDPTGSFICLDSPENDFETIHAGVDVIGNLDLNQLAVFGENDPVAVVSVFNNGGGAASEILIMPADVEATTDANIGRFIAAAALAGAGRFTIVVSAFKVVNEGAGNELVSVMVSGTRLEPPEIEFLEARPEFNKLAAAGHEKDPVQSGAIIASDILHLKVKLLTAGGAGVQTKFENYDADDNFQSAVAALPVPEGADSTITGDVPLHQGLNKIKVISRTPAINELLGDAAPPPSIVEFSLYNVSGGPRIKLIQPEQRGVLVPQILETGQKVAVKFCFTLVPTKVGGHPGGTGAPPPPAITDDCKTGSLGFTPEVFNNGLKVTGADNFQYDASTGVFTANVSPDFGNNLYEVRATETFSSHELGNATSSFSGSFVFGNPVALIQDGQIATEKTFAKRGLNLALDRSLLEGDIKKMLGNFLNRPETSDLVLNVFKKTATTPGYVCHELEQQVVSGGDTTINFNPDTFTLGAVELTELKTASDGMLHVAARINGMHGDAELRAVDGREVTYYGEDIGFLPLKISIARLDIKIGVSFKRNDQGILELDLRKDGDKPLVEVVGDGELGNFVTVDVSKNPHAAGAAYLDSQQGLVKRQFNASIEGTLVCGVEEGMNHPLTGALGKGVLDIEKLTGYNQNLFRIPLNFKLLGKDLQLDIAYHLLKGEVKFDTQGIHVRGVPLRFNPGPVKLVELAQELSTGIIGSVSRWVSNTEPSPEQSLTTGVHPLGVQLGEDAINQVLAAANLAGLLDIDLDANFYTSLGMTPIEKLAPNANSLAPNVDLNLDGEYDEEDQLTPVLMRIQTDKRTPPMLTFLTQAEIDAYAAEEADNMAAGSGEPPPDPTGGPVEEKKAFFVPEGKYFRVTLANVEFTAYRQNRIPDELGGSQTYCKKQWADDVSIKQKGFCQLNGEVLVPAENPLEDPPCETDLVRLPRKNGEIVSFGPDNTADTLDQLIPLYRMKLGFIVHGKISGVDREISAKELVTNPNAPLKTLFHLQFAPKENLERSMVLSFEMLENNTGVPDSELTSNFDTILTAAFGAGCQNLNEIRIPFVERFPSAPKPGEEPPKDLLPDFGVEYLDLGIAHQSMPQTFIDDNHLFYDVLIFAALHFTDDADSGRIVLPAAIRDRLDD